MSNRTRIILTIIASIVFVISGSRLAWDYYQTYTANASYEEIRKEAVVDVVDLEPETPDEDPVTTISIDFASLKDINTDIIAWLYIPGTPVSFPILHGTDNQTYLNRTFDKKSNVLGSIFQDYRNKPDYTDRNTIIYGHNTSSDAMFGSLKKYKQQDYAEQHIEVHIIRPDDVLVYEIFTVYEVLATSNTYTIGFGSDEAYSKYIEEMFKKSVVSVGTPPASEHIITLSTCTGGNRDMRLVLQARFIASYPLSSLSNAALISRPAA